MPTTKAASIPHIRAAALQFYRRHRRDLPWRRTRDPYAIWVSEIMLQQTQVKTVVPRYADFLARFPDVQTLAAATEQQVCEAWAGLGYYRRARHMHRAARQVCELHGGKFPKDVKALQSLAGVGRYTAGAVASIAYGVMAPVVDGNVIRLLCRLFALAGDPTRNPLQATLWELAAELVCGERPGDLNQALMELGATVCTPTRPKCTSCPLAEHCLARATQRTEELPALSKPVVKTLLKVAMLWHRDPRGVWLWRRPLEGLWAGLWEPPSQAGTQARQQLAQHYGVTLGRPVALVRHVLTHRQVEARIYRSPPNFRLKASHGLQPYADPRQAPLSGLARKVVAAMGDR